MQSINLIHLHVQEIYTFKNFNQKCDADADVHVHVNADDQGDKLCARRTGELIKPYHPMNPKRIIGCVRVRVPGPAHWWLFLKAAKLFSNTSLI